MKPENTKAAVVSILLGASMALACFQIPWGRSIDIPVNATVLNSPPSLVGLHIEGTSVDPRSMFRVRVTCADNNTVSDIDTIRLTMESAKDPASAAAVVWHEGEFQVEAGECSIYRSASEVPRDPSGPVGTWVFALSFPGDAPSGTWSLKSIARDEINSSSRSILFTVNSYISVRLDKYGGINFQAPPGQIEAKTEIRLKYTTNCGFELLGRCSSFVGSDNPSFELAPSAFSLSADSFLPTELSDSLTPVASGLPLGRDKPLILDLILDIPNPFYDQDYAGLITLMLRPQMS